MSYLAISDQNYLHLRPTYVHKVENEMDLKCSIDFMYLTVILKFVINFGQKLAQNEKSDFKISYKNPVHLNLVSNVYTRIFTN